MITLRDAYCRHYDCPPEEFEKDLLLACMNSQSAFFAKWILRFRPDFFATECSRLRSAGNVTDPRYVYDYAAEFSDPRRGGGWVRERFGIRPKGRTLIAIALEVMAAQGGPTSPPPAQTGSAT
jgi:hypothetical protein